MQELHQLTNRLFVETGVAWIAVAAVLYVLFWVVWNAFCYWLGASVMGLETATFDRAIKATLYVGGAVVLLAGLGAAATYLLSARLGPETVRYATVPCWLALGLAAVLPIFILRSAFETTARSGLGILALSYGLLIVAMTVLVPLVGLAASVAGAELLPDLQAAAAGT